METNNNFHDDFVSIPFGLHPLYDHEHSTKYFNVQAVTYNSRHHKYVILDSRGIRSWICSIGKNVIKSEFNFDSYRFNVLRDILYCPSFDIYFILTKEYQLKIFNINFHETFNVETDGASITCMMYNSKREELITVGHNKLRFWQIAKSKNNNNLNQLILNREYNIAETYLISNAYFDEHLEKIYLLADFDVWCYKSDGYLSTRILNASSTHLSVCVYSHQKSCLVTGSIAGHLDFFTPSGSKLKSLQCHLSIVTALLLHPSDSDLFMSSSTDGNIKLLSFHLLQDLVSVSVFPEGIYWMKQQSQHVIYAASAKGIKTFDIHVAFKYWGFVNSNAQKVNVFQKQKNKSAHVCVYAKDNSIKIYDLKSGKRKLTILPPPELPIGQRPISTAYDHFGGVFYILFDHAKLWVYVTKTDPATRVATWDFSKTFNNIEIMTEKSSSFGKSLNIMNLSKEYVVCQCLTSLHRKTFYDNESFVDGESSNLSVLLFGLSNGLLLFVDPFKNGDVVKSVKCHLASPIIEIIVDHSHDNVKILTIVKTSTEFLFQIWDAYSMKLTKDLETTGVFDIVAFKNNALAFAYENGSIKIIDLSEINYKTTFHLADNTIEHKGIILSIDLHIKKPILCSAGIDKFVRVWNFNKQLLYEVELDNTLCAAVFLDKSLSVLIGFKSNLFVIPCSYFSSLEKENDITTDDSDSDESFVYEDFYDDVVEKQSSEHLLSNYLIPYPHLQLDKNWQSKIYMDLKNHFQEQSENENANDDDSDSFSFADTDIYQDTIENCSINSDDINFPVCVLSAEFLESKQSDIESFAYASLSQFRSDDSFKIHDSKISVKTHLNKSAELSKSIEFANLSSINDERIAEEIYNLQKLRASNSSLTIKASNSSYHKKPRRNQKKKRKSIKDEIERKNIKEDTSYKNLKNKIMKRSNVMKKYKDVKTLTDGFAEGVDSKISDKLNKNKMSKARSNLKQKVEADIQKPTKNVKEDPATIRKSKNNLRKEPKHKNNIKNITNNSFHDDKSLMRLRESVADKKARTSKINLNKITSDLNLLNLPSSKNVTRPRSLTEMVLGEYDNTVSKSFKNVFSELVDEKQNINETTKQVKNKKDSRTYNLQQTEQHENLKKVQDINKNLASPVIDDVITRHSIKKSEYLQERDKNIYGHKVVTNELNSNFFDDSSIEINASKISMIPSRFHIPTKSIVEDYDDFNSDNRHRQQVLAIKSKIKLSTAKSVVRSLQKDKNKVRNSDSEELKVLCDDINVDCVSNESEGCRESNSGITITISDKESGIKLNKLQSKDSCENGNDSIVSESEDITEDDISQKDALMKEQIKKFIVGAFKNPKKAKTPTSPLSQKNAINFDNDKPKLIDSFQRQEKLYTKSNLCTCENETNKDINGNVDVSIANFEFPLENNNKINEMRSDMNEDYIHSPAFKSDHVGNADAMQPVTLFEKFLPVTKVSFQHPSIESNSFNKIMSEHTNILLEKNSVLNEKLKKHQEKKEKRVQSTNNFIIKQQVLNITKDLAYDLKTEKSEKISPDYSKMFLTGDIQESRFVSSPEITVNDISSYSSVSPAIEMFSRKLSVNSNSSKEAIKSLENKLSGTSHRFHKNHSIRDLENTKVKLEFLKNKEIGLNRLSISKTSISIPSQQRFPATIISQKSSLEKHEQNIKKQRRVISPHLNKRRSYQI